MVAGLIFGFDDKQAIFSLGHWVLNYIKFVIFSFISLFLFVYAEKEVSRKYGCSSKFGLWKLFRYGFKKDAKFPMKFFGLKINYFPIGIILPILIALFSRGQIFFAAIVSSIITLNPAYRLGKKFTKLTEYELAKIAIIGPLVCTILAIILSFFGNVFTGLVVVNLAFAVSYMIPLPGLNGCKVFFGSKNLYVLSFAFILACTILLRLLSPWNALFLALLIAIISLIVFFYYRVYKL